MHHILQTYHPLYNEDDSNHIIEWPQQQFYDNSARRIVKLLMQEYYDAYAYYLMLEAYINDSSKTLIDPTELRVFVHRCICGKDLYQATRFDRQNNECKYKFFPHNPVQTLLLEFSRLPSNRRSFDRSFNHSSDIHSDRRYGNNIAAALERDQKLKRRQMNKLMQHKILC